MRSIQAIGSAFSCMIAIVMAIHVEASGCSCAQNGSVQQELRSTFSVFSGHVLSIRYLHRRAPKGADLVRNVYDHMILECQIRVDHVYKGPLPSSTVLIQTSSSESSCGVDFRPGQRYIVYAFHEGRFTVGSVASIGQLDSWGLSTSLCTRTCLWNAREHRALMKHVRQVNSRVK